MTGIFGEFSQLLTGASSALSTANKNAFVYKLHDVPMMGVPTSPFRAGLTFGRAGPPGPRGGGVLFCSSLTQRLIKPWGFQEMAGEAEQ